MQLIFFLLPLGFVIVFVFFIRRVGKINWTAAKKRARADKCRRLMIGNILGIIGIFFVIGRFIAGVVFVGVKDGSRNSAQWRTAIKNVAGLARTSLHARFRQFECGDAVMFFGGVDTAQILRGNLQYKQCVGEVHFSDGLFFVRELRVVETVDAERMAVEVEVAKHREDCEVVVLELEVEF